jgi:hypothetical protein
MLLAGSLASNADSDTTIDRNGASIGSEGPTLLTPTLGRPVFVEPGSSFQVVARLPTSGVVAKFELVCGGQPEQRYRLNCEADAGARLATGQPLRLGVPSTVPRQTYDLHISCNDGELVGRHCVAVGHVGRTLRLVHLSNMNIGDVGAPNFDHRLIDEVNLVAPTLILATGDYLDAVHTDRRAGWRQLVDFFASFDAPVVMACGDHDDIESYSRHVAPSPIGLVDVGPNRCLVLFDHPHARVQDNPAQLRWIEQALMQPAFDGMTLVLSHDECPNLLNRWHHQGILTRMIRGGRIGLWFVGGHHDWDGQAFSELTDAARPMIYLQTHQSSTAPREGASGVSHYRVVDVVDDRVALPHSGPPSIGVPPSTPVGHLQATFDGPNDGSLSRLSFSVASSLPYRLDGLALTVRLRKSGTFAPWCHGARLEQAIDLGDVWQCRLRFDLPDKGGLRARAGSGPEPLPPAVSVRFEAPATFRFHQQTTSQGCTFLSSANDPLFVHVENVGEEVAVVSPLLRLDGDPLAYRPATGQSDFALVYRLRLQPGETVSLQPDLSAVRVAPGRRELQVYLHGADAVVPFCHSVDVVVDG